MTPGLTGAELLALPAAVDLATAGRALGLGRTKTYELAQRGEFPVRLLRLGTAYRCVTADLLDLLGIAPDQNGPRPGVSAPAEAHEAPCTAQL
ncbi:MULTISPECIES: integrase [Streptomyces]|uniref:integrase n=1 Tax=Streptomyces TaxID=1883 RepID=UPI002259B3AB|nr:integrase [Streptomyces virginiae]MCX5271262.1 integrase [Streptomyces virginiae]